MNRHPFVGRTGLLATLRERLDKSRCGDGGAIVLCGEAGIGKSRVLEHFRDRIAGDDPGLVATAVLDYAPSPFAPFASDRGVDGAAPRPLHDASGSPRRRLVDRPRRRHRRGAERRRAPPLLRQHRTPLPARLRGDADHPRHRRSARCRSGDAPPVAARDRRDGAERAVRPRGRARRAERERRVSHGVREARAIGSRPYDRPRAPHRRRDRDARAGARREPPQPLRSRGDRPARRRQPALRRRARALRARGRERQRRYGRAGRDRRERARACRGSGSGRPSRARDRGRPRTRVPVFADGRDARRRPLRRAAGAARRGAARTPRRDGRRRRLSLPARARARDALRRSARTRPARDPRAHRARAGPRAALRRGPRGARVARACGRRSRIVGPFERARRRSRGRRASLRTRRATLRAGARGRPLGGGLVCSAGRRGAARPQTRDGASRRGLPRSRQRAGDPGLRSAPRGRRSRRRGRRAAAARGRRALRGRRRSAARPSGSRGVARGGLERRRPRLETRLLPERTGARRARSGRRPLRPGRTVPGDLATALALANARAHALLMQRRYREALVEQSLALRSAMKRGSLEQIAATHLDHGMVCMLGGELERAGIAFGRSARVSEARWATTDRAIGLAFQAETELMRGNVPVARALIVEALDDGRRSDHHALITMAGRTGLFLAMRQRDPQFAAAVVEALDLDRLFYDRTPERCFPLSGAYSQYLLQNGKRDEAHAVLARAVDRLSVKRLQSTDWSVCTLLSVAAIGDERHFAQARRPLERWYAPFAPAFVGLFDATVAERGGDGAAAARHAEASLEPFERFGFRFETALALDYVGRKREALALAERFGFDDVAARIADELVPRNRQGRAAGTLTARERAIAELVRDGLRNREIAERLVVSEKTVESHLSSIFAKLRVRARTEIASRLAASDTADETRAIRA